MFDNRKRYSSKLKDEEANEIQVYKDVRLHKRYSLKLNPLVPKNKI